MGDRFYKAVRWLGRPAFWVSSRPTVLHAERVRGIGRAILAPNHLSPYDVPVLMRHVPGVLDFVSIVEVFRNPLAGWFLGKMNAFGLDRSRVDTEATRKILERLERGRTIVMFPEGRIRTGATSLLAGGGFKPSVARLAKLAGVPIVPCVLLGTGAYGRASAWLPIRRTRYAINFGEAFRVEDEDEAVERLKRAYGDLYAELKEASGLTVADSPWRGGAANRVE